MPPNGKGKVVVPSRGPSSQIPLPEVPTDFEGGLRLGDAAKTQPLESDEGNFWLHRIPNRIVRLIIALKVVFMMENHEVNEMLSKYFMSFSKRYLTIQDFYEKHRPDAPYNAMILDYLRYSIRESYLHTPFHLTSLLLAVLEDGATQFTVTNHLRATRWDRFSDLKMSQKSREDMPPSIRRRRDEILCSPGEGALVRQ
ncbi:MAG: hypothetical protein MMC23_004587 [Stictis urceolatum]|nr:hypothetical protein [Stictis urceolata]